MTRLSFVSCTSVTSNNDSSDNDDDDDDDDDYDDNTRGMKPSSSSSQSTGKKPYSRAPKPVEQYDLATGKTIARFDSRAMRHGRSALNKFSSPSALEENMRMLGASAGGDQGQGERWGQQPVA